MADLHAIGVSSLVWRHTPRDTSLMIIHALELTCFEKDLIFLELRRLMMLMVVFFALGGRIYRSMILAMIRWRPHIAQIFVKSRRALLTVVVVVLICLLLWVKRPLIDLAMILVLVVHCLEWYTIGVVSVGWQAFIEILLLICLLRVVVWIGQSLIHG